MEFSPELHGNEAKEAHGARPVPDLRRGDGQGPGFDAVDEILLVRFVVLVTFFLVVVVVVACSFVVGFQFGF